MSKTRETYLFRGRLAQFQKSADSNTAWDERWFTANIAAEYRLADRGNLGVYRHSFLQYLSKEGLIVEAGCGTGRYVRALERAGFHVIGMDWAEDTMKRAKSIWTDAPFSIADVSCFPLPVNSVSAVISLGVIEHFLEPWDFLSDSVRILQPGGILYLVVPYINALRKWRAGRGKYLQRESAEGFYQYLLSDEEIQSALDHLGIEVIEHFATSAYSSIGLEWPALDARVRRLPFSSRLIRTINQSRLLGKLSGHVTHYIGQKL